MNMNELATLSQDPVELIKQAQHILDVAKDAAENQDIIICSAMDYALELLRALDEKQPHYEPKSKEWLSDTANKLVDVLYGIDGGAQ